MEYMTVRDALSMVDVWVFVPSVCLLLTAGILVAFWVFRTPTREPWEKN